jgi:hypothetical protein
MTIMSLHTMSVVPFGVLFRLSRGLLAKMGVLLIAILAVIASPHAQSHGSLNSAAVEVVATASKYTQLGASPKRGYTNGSGPDHLQSSIVRPRKLLKNSATLAQPAPATYATAHMTSSSLGADTSLRVCSAGIRQTLRFRPAITA